MLHLQYKSTSDYDNDDDDSKHCWQIIWLEDGPALEAKLTLNLRRGN